MHWQVLIVNKIQCDAHVSLWTTEEQAYRSACANIIQDIKDTWDLTHKDLSLYSKVISDLITNMDYSRSRQNENC